MTQRQPIRVLLVEDHPLYRVGLRLSLNYSGLSSVVVGEAEDVKSAKRFLEQHGDGVDGYMGKDVEPETLKTKLNALFGVSDYDEDKQYRINAKADLSAREIEIIQLCANGMSAQQIADRLGLSRRTVEVHKSHIFEKLDLKTTADLVKYAYDAGLVK